MNPTDLTNNITKNYNKFHSKVKDGTLLVIEEDFISEIVKILKSDEESIRTSLDEVMGSIPNDLSDRTIFYTYHKLINLGLLQVKLYGESKYEDVESDYKLIIGMP